MEERNNGTQVMPEYVKFVSGGRAYFFTVDARLSEEGRQKRVLLGRFTRDSDPLHSNDTLPAGVEFDAPYCLKESSVFLPLGEQPTFPQHRQFWDFFPFKGENLREVIALNDDAKQMSDMLADGTLDPLTSAQPYVFKCAVLEPVYTPFNIEDFPTFHEKIECMLQIIAGLKQLMHDETLQRFKIVAHRDLKFNNVVVEKRADGSRRLRLIDFPSVKFTPREGEPSVEHTALGFFSYCNTAPEDVMPRYAVSSKTDVFALGTMLAELFEVWDYNGMRNPLMLLFTLANISSSDVVECRDFYNELSRKYPFETVNMFSTPNWLERALSCHEKIASWDKVVRVCPDIRGLFRAATVIDPHHRIALPKFESALRQMYNQLPEEEVQQTAKRVFAEKVTYFLVDTAELDAFRNVYLTAAEQVLLDAPQTRVAVLSYGCREAKDPQTPDPSLLTLTPMVANEVLQALRTLETCSRGVTDLSELKGCLYDLSGYLGNATNRQNFSGEIHIFTSQTPNEENTCYFGVPCTDASGAPTLRALTGREVADLFGSHVRIYVHTFREDAYTDTPPWYTPVYFSQKKPQTKDPVPASVYRGTAAEQDSGRVYQKGTGFHFIGGIPVEK